MGISFKEKYGDWALITGATSGIGAEMASQIAAKGLNVVLVARREKELEEQATLLTERYGIKATTVSADLSTSEGVEKVKQIDKSIGLLVLAAGIEVNGSFAKSSLEQELKMIQLNVTSVLQLTHHFTPAMIERKRGGILMVSSLSGHMVSPYFSNYAGTKAYVLQLGASLHGELKPKGIDVTVLSPGLTTTPMTADNGVDWSKLPMVAKDPAEVAEIAINGLGRKAVVVPGKRNRMTAILSGIISHQKQAIMGESMIGKAMPKNKM
ncbi:hypothetical protein BCT86_01520 [Vibrio breoganii]|uniref:SDR family NAD(P)-dependent oxidoreductase n=2 Tax=Gammaproteobacteria TaxID=1236 RepID=A0ABT0KKP2_9GAMM|nr:MULTISPECIES: SDR family NAD(P)-dependent oxidoreductase [Gammaproteobacteria]MCL1043970.1 SDR family NAD(P)-dependent oxidoreductase [Shewanella electrodiphila]PMF67914.1 hypothetical protein BCV08_18695 [Vibrio breoganii]PMG35617.1 hypothetical protein BCU93_17380 [Vibrio breoganii]PMG78887.1 hypothetical protein BCU83_13945 [Vibrio breoganii]PMG90303.1 hypothetical protein BCU80_15080 [Vibrio breoganii]